MERVLNTHGLRAMWLMQERKLGEWRKGEEGVNEPTVPDGGFGGWEGEKGDIFCVRAPESCSAHISLLTPL